MPTWSAILDELNKSGRPPKFDGVRRKYLVAAHQQTGRNTILYATKWTQHDPNTPPEVISIVDEDLQAAMEVVHGLSGPDLDLILHSPGGSLEATEALVTYLRSKFDHIRVVVPSMAMSAATMVACAADIVVLGKHSFLGPIDPQMIISTPLGQRMVPAQAIRDQFAMAKKECQDPRTLGAWLPMLSQYGPDLLVQCKNVSDLSRTVARTWLQTYMFKADPDGERKARRIAAWLSAHKHFKSHARHISRSQLEEIGLKVAHMEDNQAEQDLFLSVFHATTHTFSSTRAVKIIENHLGKAFIKQAQQILVQVPMPQGAIPMPPSAPAPNRPTPDPK